MPLNKSWILPIVQDCPREVLQVTRIVLPGMKKRKRSAIVNIGSAAATVAPSGPLYAVYAGTKVTFTSIPFLRLACLKCWHYLAPTLFCMVYTSNFINEWNENLNLKF